LSLAAGLIAATAVSLNSASPDVVLYAANATVRVGAWNLVDDPTAAGGAALRNPDLGAAKLTTPLASPSTYFELTFDVVAGQPYHLWIRGKADKNSWANDSVYVQFADDTGTPTAPYGRGTTSAAAVSIEDCSGCNVAGWGWQDQAYGAFAADIVFDRSGTHTIRIQPREDGLTIDQIVLSPSTYLTRAPGALKNDTTILPADGNPPPPPPPPPAATLVRQPFLQQMTSTSVKIVWTTRELMSGAVQVRTGVAAPTTYHATSTRFTAAATGTAADYYQYVADVEGLQPSTTYNYTLQMNGANLTNGTDRLVTAPAPGTATTRFIAFGDSGVGSPEQYALARLMAADRFDFLMHLGDIVYGSSATTGPATHTGYQNWFFDVYRDILRGKPVFPTIGNHDDAIGAGRAYRDVFVLPEEGASATYPDHAERFYSFDYGPVHFVSLDTETAFLDTARRQAQIAWLQGDLAATTREWKVVFFHRPPYSTGFEHGSDLTIRSVFSPIFEQNGVQLVLSGHDHDYERTLPMKTDTDPSARPVTYIVSGGGGAALYTVSGGSFTAAARSAYHYVRAEATECQLMVQPIGLDGAPFDTLTLDRCGTTTPPGEIVVYAQDVPSGNIIGADWSRVADTTAPTGFALKEIDRGRAKVLTPVASPATYVDVPFSAEAGVPYQFWFHMKAQNNSLSSDSVYVQFSNATDANLQRIYAMGSTKAASVILENGSGAGISGWGWTDSSYGGLAAPIYFATPGPQTLRIQSREDGVSIDQIVISGSTYLTTAPGATRNDATKVPKP
jgi:3',5'-cyclic AMP phosphodiesterase CpdA